MSMKVNVILLLWNIQKVILFLKCAIHVPIHNLSSDILNDMIKTQYNMLLYCCK